VHVQSNGYFWTNITGSGTATLREVNSCALQLIPYIKDPKNWVSDNDPKYVYSYTKFLRNNLATFTNVSGCAEQIVSTPDRLMTLAGSGFICPTRVGSIAGIAGPRQISLSFTMMIFALAVSYAIQQLALTPATPAVTTITAAGRRR